MEEKARGGKQDRLASLANQERRREPMFREHESEDELGLEIDIQMWPEVRGHSSMTVENNM